MSATRSATGLAITNPLVLYRSLLAIKRINPDPAQHRLALQLQKIYNQLLDYEPALEYEHRLNELAYSIRARSDAVARAGNASLSSASPISGLFSFTKKDEVPDKLALVKKLTSPEAAVQIDSPRGLLLHGEVGTGKSMLVDMLATSLPSRKKRRWHFNTFMLEVFAKIEKQRKAQVLLDAKLDASAYSLLIVARDLIAASPILFLDEFQLPDRAASKILSNLLTLFFQLGGVLIATSNRMPEELANAAGAEFMPPPISRPGLFNSQWRLFNQSNGPRINKSPRSSQHDFATFLEVLRARCEVWEMEGTRDWRKCEIEEQNPKTSELMSDCDVHSSGLEPLSPGNLGLGFEQSQQTRNTIHRSMKPEKNFKLPYRYFLSSPEAVSSDRPDIEAVIRQLFPADGSRDSKTLEWTDTVIRVYGRELQVPRTLSGITQWTFQQLCCTTLGPADYISLASNYHTFILTDVPVLTFLYKNEARRFITLLDALYEARCKLIIQAASGPDELFFPETQREDQQTEASGGARNIEVSLGDATLPETFSEIFQETTSPFRPNISSYEATASPLLYEQSKQYILADKDSDFGPTYGAGQNSSRGSGDGAPGAGHEIGRQLDFNKTGAFIGEDERFAYKRAASRLWEMCGKRWWERTEQGWWQPLIREARSWEGGNDIRRPQITANADASNAVTNKGHIIADTDKEKLFRHGASPFRTCAEAPPRFSWTHAWGMMRWGKKTGTWGKGVEGLKEKKNNR